MKIKIQTRAVFEVPFTQDQLMALRILSESHYDAVCRSVALGVRDYQAESVSGILQVWERDLMFEHPSSLTSRELGICMKIIERRLDDPVLEAARQELGRAFGLAWLAYDKVYDTWTVTVDSEDK